MWLLLFNIVHHISYAAILPRLLAVYQPELKSWLTDWLNNRPAAQWYVGMLGYVVQWHCAAGHVCCQVLSDCSSSLPQRHAPVLPACELRHVDTATLLQHKHAKLPHGLIAIIIIIIINIFIVAWIMKLLLGPHRYRRRIHSLQVKWWCQGMSTRKAMS